MDLMSQVLDKFKATGKLPGDFKSKEETNTLGPSNVTEEQLEEARASVKSLDNNIYLIVDGIMIYYKGSPLLSKHQLDIALLLRSPYAELKQRREARSGYVTLEGFWKDPPGYFDDIVWPGYVKAHSHLFLNNQVDGPLTEKSKTEYKIRTPDRMDYNMLDLLHWSINQINDY